MKFAIYERKTLAIGEEEIEKQYQAISEEAIKQGLIVPASSLTLFPEPVGEVEADTPEHAINSYRDRMANLFG